MVSFNKGFLEEGLLQGIFFFPDLNMKNSDHANNFLQ